MLSMDYKPLSMNFKPSEYEDISSQLLLQTYHDRDAKGKRMVGYLKS